MLTLFTPAVLARLSSCLVGAVLLLGPASHAHALDPDPAFAQTAGAAPPATAKPRARTRPASLHYLPIQPLTIVAGEILMLPVKGKIVRLALGSGNMLSTTTVDSHLLLIAEQVGSTSLLVWTADTVYSYRVSVVPKDVQLVRAKVDAMTRGVSGIQVEQLGNELVLSGTVHKEVLQQLSSTLRDLPGVVFNIREDQGQAYTRSVLFRLHFMEVKRSFLEKIGVDWAKSGNGPVFGAMGVASKQGVFDNQRQLVPGESLIDSAAPPFVIRGTSSGGLFLGLATTLTSRLNLGISNGDVRILASPELTARSGGKAKLQVGGQVPIPMAGALGATSVDFKNYGILFAIEPFIDANDIISARVSTELSQIDPAVTVSGIPGFLTRSTSTEVSLKAGEVVALSGIVNSEMSSAIDRVPALSRVPILGRLFRSDDFRNNRSELVVLLEPQIITAGEGLARQLRERGEGIKKEFDDKMDAMQRKSDAVQAPVQTPFTGAEH